MIDIDGSIVPSVTVSATILIFHITDRRSDQHQFSQTLHLIFLRSDMVQVSPSFEGITLQRKIAELGQISVEVEEVHAMQIIVSER